MSAVKIGRVVPKTNMSLEQLTLEASKAISEAASAEDHLLERYREAGRYIYAISQHFGVKQGATSKALKALGTTWAIWVRDNLKLDPSTCRKYIRAYQGTLKDLGDSRSRQNDRLKYRHLYLGNTSEDVASSIGRIVAMLRNKTIEDLKSLEDLLKS